MERSDVRDLWADRTGAYSPDYYAHHGPNDMSELVREYLDPIPREGPVLELGCSSGRHLAHLREAGFEDLHGIDVNEAAFDVLAEEHPELAEGGTFYADAFEDVVPEFEDDQFAAVYSVESIQHVHPDAEWLFEEIARVTGRRLVTIETEGEPEDRAGEGVNYVADEVPLYYRDWQSVFEPLGLEQVDCRSARRGTVRVFDAS